ncbi:porin family protein [Flammeovirgaceae bacterium SG7u.111]|nr:porin family protein [Flammeovirgaceae bacterium SG7u.132]WPO34426.1 porin family protein [Flammeovirgaceae bacterium SG7u.111]
MKKCIPLFLLMFISFNLHSQVLISLLLGDKLNSPNLEFGLEGGFNWSGNSGFESNKKLRTFNLGFYFDIRLKEQLFLYTGVLVKSKLGAAKLSDADLAILKIDKFQEEGDYSQVLQSFVIPIFAKYKLKNHFYIEGGPQLGWQYKSWVEFNQSNADMKSKVEVFNKDDVTMLDAGFAAGFGYQLMKGKGMTFGVKYYYGLVNVMKNIPDSKNNSLFLKMNIPVGAGKKKE